MGRRGAPRSLPKIGVEGREPCMEFRNFAAVGFGDSFASELRGRDERLEFG